MKSSIRIRKLRTKSFIESMRGLFDRTRFLKHHKQDSLENPTQKNSLPIHPLLLHASLPISLLVTIKYGEDVMKALSLIKVDYSLVEVNEDTVLIEVNLQSNEDKSKLIENLKSLSWHSFPTTLEEHNHVNH